MTATMNAKKNRENIFSMNEVVKKVAASITQLTGNVLEEKQYDMISNRLQKRFFELGLKDHNEYISFLESNQKTEMNYLVGLLTTHHTFFFREFVHFEFLLNQLPTLVAQAKKRGSKLLRIWSAACSRGHEVYSLAIFMNTHLKEIDKDFDYEIWGTDIDEQSVKFAMNSVYHQNEVKEIPMLYLANNFAKGTGEISNYVKIKKSIYEKCKFKTLNLLNFKSTEVPIFDVILCRNVLIYFKEMDVKKIIENFKPHLYPDGFLITGVSESLTGNSNVYSLGKSCYHLHPQPSNLHETKTKLVLAPITNSSNNELVKVLCVDDSSSILKILQKMLTKENGFEIVGTASNGNDAHAFLEKNKVDVMTLDIHMPEMDGVTYLRKYFKDQHPPVVMVSSVSREDNDLAHKSILFGASDFVEKPSLENFELRADEIRMKLLVAHKRKLNKLNNDRKVLSQFDQQVATKIKITDPDKKLITLLSSVSDVYALANFFKDLEGECPPSLILIEGSESILPTIQKTLVDKISKKYEVLIDMTKIESLKSNQILILDFQKSWVLINSKIQQSGTVCFVYGALTKNSYHHLKQLPRHIPIFAEESTANSQVKELAQDMMPVTSFAYTAKQKLGTSK